MSKKKKKKYMDEWFLLINKLSCPKLKPLVVPIIDMLDRTNKAVFWKCLIAAMFTLFGETNLRAIYF